MSVVIGREEVKIIVRCPKCGFEYKTIVAKISRCRRCGYTFTIFTKKGKSRMIKIVSGTYDDFVLAYNTFVNKK